MTAWNFFGLTINFLFLNQWVTTFNLNCKEFFNSSTVFAKADKELSSENLNHLSKNQTGFVLLWSLEGDQKLSFENHFFYHLYKNIEFGL